MHFFYNKRFISKNNFSVSLVPTFPYPKQETKRNTYHCTNKQHSEMAIQISQKCTATMVIKNARIQRTRNHSTKTSREHKCVTSVRIKTP